MTEFYYGNDLYNDLFLNNNRELYIKMFLLDLNEPEIDEFYIRDVDITGTGATALASKIIIPYSDNIVNGDSLNLVTIDLDAFRNTKVTWGNTFGYNITNKTFTGRIGNNYATVNNSDEIVAGMTLSCPTLFSTGAKITSLSGTTVYFDRTLTATGTNATSTVYTNKTYGYLNTTNFYVNSLNTFYSLTKSSMWGVASAGRYYKSNRYNRILVSSKEIQGSIIDGSLKMDGNSSVRRTIDFSCIVPREFQKEGDLKLSDFDNKKIKILIGIKDSIVSSYDYSQYFNENGTQKDLKDIVWFKMGTYIARNVNIKHSTDSFQVSITAQDKMSSLDGSFGGVLGVGKEFKNPVTGWNTSFYDTIIDSFKEHTQENPANIEVSFTDPYQISKFPPLNYSGNFITAGSTLMRVQDISDLYVGMNIDATGVYKGTKIAGMSLGATFANISMDYVAFSTIPSNETILTNGKPAILRATFSNPSYKDFFAIQPLITNDEASTMYMKQTSIAFKGSTYVYGSAGNIYTTIKNWAPDTWGPVLLNQQKPYYTNSFSGQEISITGQDASTDSFISKTPLEIGDVLFTGSDTGSLQLTPYRFYYVKEILSPSNFRLGDVFSGSTYIDITTTLSNQNISTTNYDRIYQSSIQTDKIIYDISYNRFNSKFYVITNASNFFWLISRYDSYSNNSSQQTMIVEINSTSADESPAEKVSFSNDGLFYFASVKHKAIFGYSLPAFSGQQTFPSRSAQILNQYVSYSGSSNVFLIEKKDGYGSTELVNSPIFVLTRGNLTAVSNNSLYFIKEIVYDDGGSTVYCKLKDMNGGEVIVPASLSDGGNSSTYRPISCLAQVTDRISKMVCDNAGNLVLCGLDRNIVKYNQNKTTQQMEIIQEIADTRGYTSIDVDSFDNIYGISNSKNSIIKISSDYSKGVVLSKTISSVWQGLSPTSNFTTYPVIEFIGVDSTDNVFLVTGGTYLDGAVSKNINVNIIMLASDDLSIISSVKYFDNLGDYSKGTIGKNNIFFYPRNESPNIKLTQFSLLTPFTTTNINALREFSPQTDSTIVKDNSEKVSSILEDVKNQLGSYQYFYDSDGRFVFKEDKRLSYIDDDFAKVTPYDLNFDDYNINTGEIPLVFDFTKNSEMILDYSNNTDLSAFKNDFLIYGSKKGIEESSSNINTTMLYHLMVDDLKLKEIPNNYYNPWQQYIIDQGSQGTTFASFQYYKELKEWFEFTPSRGYNADPSYTYVPGEFILVNNTLAGASSTSSYSLYEVITGGTPSVGLYPFKKDGTQEWLNSSLSAGTGLSVRFHKSAFGPDYKKHQGVYYKFFILENKAIAIRPGSYFIGTAGNNQQYIFQIENIYYYNSSGVKVYFGEDDRPISINLYNNPFSLSDMNIIGKKYLDNKLTNGGSIDLGGLSTCYVDIVNVGSYRPSQNQGIFRSENSGIYFADFDYLKNPNGNPESWTYFFDIINIIGRYEKNLSTGQVSSIGITNWAPSFNYQTNDLVYSDGKIYQAVIGGTSGTIAPTGYGDEQNLIRQTDVPGSKLIWRLNQISASMDRLKVSSIGSRKASLFDKDINTLFAPKESLAYFSKSGYYLFVIDDYLGYDTYSETFHRSLEYLVRQFTKLYPDIKLIFMPESQVQSLFSPNKLTILKSALSSMKKNLYLSFIGGQSIAINSIPIYSLEPLNMIKVSDEQSETYGNFLFTDITIPLSNEGTMLITAVKTHPYNDNSTVLPETLLDFEIYTNNNILGDTVFL